LLGVFGSVRFAVAGMGGVLARQLFVGALVVGMVVVTVVVMLLMRMLVMCMFIVGLRVERRRRGYLGRRF
jgi:hypothetical protein